MNRTDPSETSLARPPAPRRVLAGQSTIDYLIVFALVGISLTTGPQSPLEVLFRAIGEHYTRLTDALSRP